MYVCEVRESVHTKSTGPLSPVTLHIQRTCVCVCVYNVSYSHCKHTLCMFSYNTFMYLVLSTTLIAKFVFLSWGIYMLAGGYLQ